MLEKTKDIANRIRALREDLGETKKQVAEKIAISLDLYSVYESGREDIPASVLAKIAAALRIDMGLLLTGETPKMSQFSVTRRGKGVRIEQKGSYQYENIAASFQDAEFEPFIITLSPYAPNEIPSHHKHPGQEFNYVLKGKLGLSLGGNEVVLDVGDSVIFESSNLHGLKAIDGDVVFLAVISNAAHRADK